MHRASYDTTGETYASGKIPAKMASNPIPSPYEPSLAIRIVTLDAGRN